MSKGSPATTADGGSVVDRFRVDVRAAEADTMRQTLADANGAGVEDGISRRGFVRKRLHAGDLNGAFGIEARALGTVVAHIKQDARRELPLDVHVPDLHVRQTIVGIHGEIVGDRGAAGRGKTIL